MVRTNLFLEGEETPMYEDTWGEKLSASPS